MAYYTLAPKGHEWFAGKVAAPRTNLKILNALAGLLKENDVPRTPEQIARVVAMQPKATENALEALLKEGFVAQTKLPQPIEKMMTPKPRIRPIEEIAASEMRAEEARRRYDQSEKGRVAHKNYEHSDKGKVKNKDYWSNRGRLIQKAYRIRRNIKSMTTLKIAPDLIAEEQTKLKAVEAELAREEEEE